MEAGENRISALQQHDCTVFRHSGIAERYPESSDFRHFECHPVSIGNLDEGLSLNKDRQRYGKRLDFVYEVALTWPPCWPNIRTTTRFWGLFVVGLTARSLMHPARFLVAAFSFALGSSVAVAKDTKTAAPPNVQESITGFLSMIARSQHQCSRMGKPKVVSSELSPGATVTPEGRLTSGSIVEEWHVRMCGPKIRYRFTIAPDSKGTLSLQGFEPLR